jgi:hypothetical protein
VKYSNFYGTCGNINSTLEIILKARKGAYRIHDRDTIYCCVPEQGVLGPILPPGNRDLTGRQPSGTLVPEDGRLTSEGWVVVVK